MSQRSRETGFFSATTGLCVLLVGITCIQVAIFHALFFAETTEARQYVMMVGDIFALAGLAFFVPFVEYDLKGGIPGTRGLFRTYRYTAIAHAILTILIPVVLLEILDVIDSEIRFLLIFLEIFPAFYATRAYIHRFRDMQVVKRNNAPRRFFGGLILVGLSNFLPALHLFLSFWVFGVTSAVIVGGAFLMASSWAQFPRLEDLQWMRSLDRLIVFEGRGGLPLFEHTFSPNLISTVEPRSTSTLSRPSNTGIPMNLNPALAAGAISGLDSLLGEILASKGHINEIDYGEKKALFYRGKRAIFMLIVTTPSQELLFRLEMFGLSFERQYARDFEKVKTELELFQGADTLMWKYFS